ncbi:MGH1-like glycoside hydrolase domain-containing protein [Pseudactinotalea sp.]|uniref:MGH1-like glycoside hydrolase domain-containing protein n=1 Tax=Pseudactinotalea sp. TaxID=1926260 RepID=UPI003B3A235D
MNIDDALTGPHRSLRTRPDRLLLGPTGRRLWAESLEDVPGFSGSIDYVHKINIPLLFTITPDRPAAPERSDGTWRPSHLRSRQRFDGGVSVDETRFVTWTDEAVSIQEWVNTGTEPVQLTAAFDGDWCRLEADGRVRGDREITAYDFTIHAEVSASDPQIWTGVDLAPGGRYRVQVVAAVRHTSGDPLDPVIEKTSEWDAVDGGLLERQLDEYQQWFDGVPDLRTGSPMLDRTWAYRWYILRSCLTEPQLGLLPGLTVTEGRSHKHTKEPWAVAGHEFSMLVPLSTPFHVVDLRWHHDPAWGTAAMTAAAATQNESGELCATKIRRHSKGYANYFGHALAEFAQVHGRDALPPQAVEAAVKQALLEHRAALHAGADELPIEADHKRTGKEYQPSYWYFHDYPSDAKDPETFTPLKRVDRAIYTYLNARAAAGLIGGDPRATELTAIAEQVRRSILDKQWDAESGFFYDLHHDTDEQARVRNVVGFYPWWAGLTDEQHLPGLRAAVAPDLFGTPLRYPSTAQDCPAFRPQGGWMGNFLKGRNGCMWNGPAWPYTTGIALDAIGGAAQRHGDEASAQEFSAGLWSYLRSHFRDGDLAVPYLVEHYDPLTGEPISDEPDYNHSSLIDVLVRHVVGLQPGEGELVVAPLDIGAGDVALHGVRIGAHVLDVEITGAGEQRRVRVACRGTQVHEGACGDRAVVAWDAEECAH